MGLAVCGAQSGPPCAAQGIPLPYAPAPSGAPHSQMSRPVKRPIPIQAPPEMGDQVRSCTHAVTPAAVLTRGACMRTHRCTAVPDSEQNPAREQCSPSDADSCGTPVMLIGPESDDVILQLAHLTLILTRSTTVLSIIMEETHVTPTRMTCVSKTPCSACSWPVYLFCGQTALHRPTRSQGALCSHPSAWGPGGTRP